MASHFSSIGVPDDQEALEAALRHALTQGGVQEAPGGESVVLWNDAGSGASIAVTLAATGSVECAKPYLAASTPTRVMIEALHDHLECQYCSILVVQVLEPESGETLYPLAVEVPDLAVVGPALTVGGAGRSWISGIAHRVDLFPDEAGYRLALTRAEWEQFLPGETYRQTCPTRAL